MYEYASSSKCPRRSVYKNGSPEKGAFAVLTMIFCQQFITPDAPRMDRCPKQHCTSNYAMSIYDCEKTAN